MEARKQRGLWSCLDVRFIAFSLVAAGVILGAAVLSRRLPLGSPGRIALALLQGAASAWVVVGVVQSIGRLDELQRKIQLEALALAFAGTGVLASGYGFLVNAGLPDIDWGTLVWPAMVVLWVVGVVVAGRRYR